VSSEGNGQGPGFNGGTSGGRNGGTSGGNNDGTSGGHSKGYKWVALSNTTLGTMMATIDVSIVIISMPAIFRGIHLNPLAPGNISYLLWMIMGYLLVTATLVVTLGRLGDMFGRVRIYNLGFVIFTLASIALSLDPLLGTGGAIWLIGWRVVQATGGSMLMANSAAILTDAFPANQRGLALGTNQIAGIAGQFIGLLAGGLLAAWDWRAVFWVNVPIGVFGTVWAYRKLRETSTRQYGRIDWPGNVSFALGTGLLLIGITFGIQPRDGHTMGWGSPLVLGLMIAGGVLLVAFCVIETKVAEPMFRMGLFKIRAFAAGNAAGLLAAIARGGLQFMLIIWLQGIWLPLHGFDYAETPLWAGIYLLPLTAGFLFAGPVSGYLSDRFGARLFSTGGLVLSAAAFAGLMLLPIDFPYWAFGLLILLAGLSQGLFSSPNTSSIMSSVPARLRGAASGMRATFLNAGMSLSIGIFFSLMIAGLASRLPRTLFTGLTAHGVPGSIAGQVAHLPPVSTVFAAFLGINPIGHLLQPSGVLARLPQHTAQTLTGKQFFPELVSGPFHYGLIIVFTAATAMAIVAALASVLRGAPYYFEEESGGSAGGAPERGPAREPAGR
jgi:MFS family permease